MPFCKKRDWPLCLYVVVKLPMDVLPEIVSHAALSAVSRAHSAGLVKVQRLAHFTVVIDVNINSLLICI